jgi:hypothetical protein
MFKFFSLIQFVLLIAVVPKVQAQSNQISKLHIIIIGAHPDDPDKVGGTAYKWARMGCDVLWFHLQTGMRVIRLSNPGNLQKSGGKKPGRPVKLLE